MKNFIIGTTIMILAAIATPFLGHTGFSGDMCAVALICVACIGFLFQLAGLFTEKARLDDLDARFRYLIAELRTLRRAANHNVVKNDVRSAAQ